MRRAFLAPLLAGALVLSGCQTPQSGTTSDASGSTSPSSVPILELSVGTCLNDVDQPLAQDLTEVPAVSCSQPHQSEVYAEVSLRDSDYPGVDAVIREAQRQCIAEFTQFVGIDFAASGLNFHYYYPTASSWAVGDRSIYCVVFDPGVETVGSLAGAAR